jgi:hypothetical protein
MKKRLGRINYGAQTQAGAESDADSSHKKARKQGVFSGRESTQTAQVGVTFYYPDYTVGLGITPSHALRARGLYHRSGIHLLIANVTLPRRLNIWLL